MSNMWISSNIRTIVVRRGENNELSMEEVDPMEVSNQINYNYNDDVFMHPILIALTNSLIMGNEMFMNLEEEKNTLTEDEFKNLDIYVSLQTVQFAWKIKK